MRRVLIAWRGIHIYSYPALLYVGIVLGIIVGTGAADTLGLSRERFYVAAVLLVVPALLGARLGFVAGHWETYRHDKRRIWRRSDGGQVMYAGLALAAVSSVPLLRALDLSFLLFWDAATFAILTGMAFARVGCLLNGCCSGRPADGPLTMELPDHHGIVRRRIPVQLLEAGLAITLLAGALWLLRGAAPVGTIFPSALATYGLTRMQLQNMRERERLVGGTSFQRAFSAVLLIGGATWTASAWLLSSVP